MKYFVIFLVLVGFIGTAFGQYLGDKFPQGTIFPDYEGDHTFPPDYVDFYYFNSQFEKYSVITDQYIYDIPYMISNGIISNMDINCSDVELVLNVESLGDNGWITLALPRNLIDSKMGGSNDDDFFVLLDSQETQHSDFTSEKLRILLIPFSNNTSQVNVIGLNYPEQMGENACNGKHEPPFSYLLSTLKQFNSGISLNEIQCKENLVLLQKYDGSPTCVTEPTKTQLIERGWTGYDVSATYDYTIKTGGVTYGSQYQISGGTVDEIVYDEDRNSLFISLDGTKQGYIQIVIQTGLLHHPRELPFNYIVIIDGEEIEFEQLSPVILRIPFEKEDQQIEIVGTVEEPLPSCKSDPMPDGEGWVFIDCNWEQYADVPVDSCVRGTAPANNYAWNSQDCLWEWSPLRNENSSGTTEHLSEEKPSVKLTDDQICGSGEKLVDGICINPNVDHFDAGLNQILLFVSIGVIISIVSFIIWRKRK